MTEKQREKLVKKYIELSAAFEVPRNEDICPGCHRPLSVSPRGRKCRNEACPAFRIWVR